MSLIKEKINKLLLSSGEKTIYCFYSTDDYLLNLAAKKAIDFIFQSGDAEITKINGPQPSIEAAIAAAGTISFFGTKRIVELSLIEPSAMVQADVDALCDLADSLENASLIITCLFKDDKAKTTKKAKQIIEKAKKLGVAEEISKLTDGEIRDTAINKAKELGAILTASNAALLTERCKSDAELIENEVSKLAALSNYGEITADMIISAATLNVEADVFEMVRLVSARNKVKTFEVLQKLIQLQTEPIAISAALSSSFVDVYRVKCATEKGKGYAYAFKEYGYTGSDYRLKKAGETAAKFNKKQLTKILQILLELDVQLKSSAVDNIILLQTAICEIVNTGAAK